MITIYAKLTPDGDPLALFHCVHVRVLIWSVSSGVFASAAVSKRCAASRLNLRQRTGSEIKCREKELNDSTFGGKCAFSLRSLKLNTDWWNCWFSCKNHKLTHEHLHWVQTGNVCIIINPPPTKATPQKMLYSYVKWLHSITMFRLINTVLIESKTYICMKRQIYFNSFLAEQKTPLANATCTY